MESETHLTCWLWPLSSAGAGWWCDVVPARQEQFFAKAVVFVERTCQVTHRKLLYMRGTKQCSSFCHVCAITSINDCSRTLLYCLRDEVAIDATSLIDSCATQSVPVDGEAVVATQAQAAVDGKAVVATQAQAVLFSCRCQKVMSFHYQCS